MAVATLRPAAVGDAEPIRAIYNLEVPTGTVRSTLSPVARRQGRGWRAIRRVPRVVAVPDGDAGEVVGFAALSPYKDRAAYRTTVEDSVYVHRDPRAGHRHAAPEPARRRRPDSGFHAVMARIEASGKASRALHASAVRARRRRTPGRPQVHRWLDVAVMHNTKRPRAARTEPRLSLVGREGFELFQGPTPADLKFCSLWPARAPTLDAGRDGSAAGDDRRARIRRAVDLGAMPTFDVVSEVDRQEVRNAVDQAQIEIANQFEASSAPTHPSSRTISC